MIANWPNKWFGFWREYGQAYHRCPSIRDFVNPLISLKYDRLTAQVVASTSRSSFPCPFTGERKAGSISIRTDGSWLWLDDLADYIDDYNVVIPANWLTEIEIRSYIPPRVDLSKIQELQQPPVD